MHIVKEIPQFFHFYEQPIIQDIVDFGYTDTLNPQSGFEARTSGNLKFLISGNDSFVYLAKSFVKVKFKLTGTAKLSGGNISTAYEKIDKSGLSVVNNIAHSIFRWIRVKLGNQIITLGDGDYPYKAYLQLLCNTSREAQDTYFRVTGWKKDKAGHMDAGIPDTDVASKSSNPALHDRRSEFFTLTDGIGEFTFKPHTGINFINKAIIPFVDIEFELARHDNPHFFLKSKIDDASSSYNIEILDAKYYVQRFKNTVRFVSDLEKMLEQHPIVYRIRDGHINTCTIPANTSNYSNENLFHGQIPRRILIAFVSTAHYNGDRTKNPFNLQHFNISSLRILKNGLEYPYPETLTDFKNTPQSFIEAYHRMMMSFGADYNDHVVSVTPYEYANGYFFYSFYMAPDQESGSDLNNLSNKPSQIRIELRFAENLGEAVQMLVYYESDSTVSIDHLRRVVVEHQ